MTFNLVLDLVFSIGFIINTENICDVTIDGQDTIYVYLVDILQSGVINKLKCFVGVKLHATVRLTDFQAKCVSMYRHALMFNVNSNKPTIGSLIN